MKRTLLTLFILIIIFFVIIFMLFMYSKNIQKSTQSTQKFNAEYEQYIEKEITGTDLATIISKAINNNEKNNIIKNNKNIYIEDDEYCLKIIVKFLDSDNYYEMEILNNLGIDKFIANFNLAKFKCTEHKYNKINNRIGKIVFSEVKT